MEPEGLSIPFRRFLIGILKESAGRSIDMRYSVIDIRFLAAG